MKEIWNESELKLLNELLTSDEKEFLNTTVVEERRAQSEERGRPTYHFTAPHGRLNDPNGLCYWKGYWHLFYQNNPGEAWMWGHAVSRDLIHWKDLPRAILPSVEKECWSGMVMIEEDRAIAAYFGLGAGIMIATSNDPLLVRWEKVNGGEPIIPLTSPDGKQKYMAFDPCIWKNGDKYNLISGKFTINDHSGTRERQGYLFESADLVNWELIGTLVENDLFAYPDDDLACPYFLPCCGRHLLFHFSHHSGPKILVGDYDAKRNKFVVSGGRHLTSTSSHFGGLLAPAAFPDISGDGTLKAIYNVCHVANPPFNYQVMSLPRSVSLSGKNNNDIDIAPAEQAELLRVPGSHKEIRDIQLKANEVYVPDIKGDTIELIAEFEAKNVPVIEIKVMVSEDEQEYSAIRIFRQRGFTYLPAFAKDFTYRKAHESVIQLDTTFSSKSANVRIPDEQAFWIAPEDKLNVRVFLDKSIVEVFVNGKAAMAAKVSPDGDARGIAITSRGDDLTLNKLESYELSL
ncbi:MAG: glycoside hydrolase family 32 protein [Clostridia bacterium]|nr:glycoside hydrolase family 32 protein [Clostridia bacterium]